VAGAGFSPAGFCAPVAGVEGFGAAGVAGF
jgi:hypothetical protein